MSDQPLPKVTLRTATPADAEFIRKVRQDPATLNQLHSQKHFTLQEVRSHIERNPGGYLIVETESGWAAGYVRISEDAINSCCMIGCDIMPKQRRKGYGESALRLAIEQRTHQFRRFWLEVLPHNKTAIALYEKIGFRWEGVKLDAVIAHDVHGKRFVADSHIYSLFPGNVTTGRSVRVIATWFGNRRGSPQTPGECRQLLDRVIDAELHIDAGVEHDTLIMVPVVPAGGDPFDSDVQACCDMVNGMHGCRNASGGKVVVLSRDNIGLSFGSFSDAFQQRWLDYDYWWFTEDDQLVTKPGVFRAAIDQLEADARVGFVATVGVSNAAHHKIHAYGGCGVTSRRILRKVAALDDAGMLPHCRATKWTYSDHELGGEVLFTGRISDLGYKIVRVSIRGANECFGTVTPHAVES